MANDPHWNSVVLAMHMDDAGMTDVKGHDVTLNGDVALSDTETLFAPYSAYFDGAGDYLSLASSDDWALDVFTVETWVNFSTTPAAGEQYAIVYRWEGATEKRCFYFVLLNDAGTLQLAGGISSDGTSANSAAVAGNWTPSIGVWHHVAFVHTGSEILLFADGQLLASAETTIFVFSADIDLTVGAWTGGTGGYLSGYLSELRITKGVARYTDTFDVPEEPFSTTPPQLSGTVLDSSGAPVARVVRAYDHYSGELVGSCQSSPSDGSFSFDVYDDAPLYVVCLTEDPFENSLIFDFITPV